MIAVFKKELRSAFSHIYGWIVLGILLFVMGAFFYLYNLTYTSENIVGMISVYTLISAFAIPVLAVKVFPNRRKSNTDAAYHLLPVSSWSVVLGKYLSAFAILSVPNLLSLLLPLVSGFFSVQNHAQSYGAVLAMVLFQSAWLAVCTFISRLLNNRWLAALTCYGVGIVWFLSVSVTFFIPKTTIASFVALSVVIVAIGVCIGFITKRVVFSVVLAGALEAAAVVLLVTGGTAMSGLFEKIVVALSVFNAFDVFTAGIFDLKSILLFVVVTVLFIFLAWRLYEGNYAQRETRMAFSLKRATSLLLAILLIAASMAVCVSASFVPNTLSAFDSTSSRKNSVSAEAKVFLSTVDKDVTVYLLESSGAEDYEFYLEKLASSSPRLTLKKVYYDSDAELFSSFSISYADAINGYVSDDLVLVCGDRRQYISHEELFIYYNSVLYSNYGIETMDYKTLREYESALASMGVSTDVLTESTVPLYFNGDAVICSYIEYIVADVIPTPYYLVGHGEPSLSDSSNPYAELGIPELDISGGIPADASSILINMPTEDISAEEVTLLLEYLKNGGQLTFVTNDENLDMPNLCSVLAAYGLSAKKETVNIYEAAEEEEQEKAEDEENTEENTEENEETEATEEETEEGEEQTQAPAVTDAFIPSINTQNNDIFYYVESYNNFEITLKGTNPIVFDEALVTAAKTVTELPVITTPAGAFLGENYDTQASYAVAYAIDTPEGARLVWFTGGESYNSVTEDSSVLVLMALDWATLKYVSNTGSIPPVIYTQIPVAIESITAPAIGLVLVLAPVAMLVFGIIKVSQRKRGKAVKIELD